MGTGDKELYFMRFDRVADFAPDFLQPVMDWFAPGGSAATRRAEPHSGGPCLEPLEVRFSGHAFETFDLRSEDVRFSPDGRRIIVISTNGRMLLFSVRIGARRMRAKLLTMFTSADLRAPHGVDWVDDEHVVVANRSEGIAFFAIPRARRWKPQTPISAISKVQPHWFGAPGEMRTLRSRKIITGAGSARVFDGHVYIGSNKANTVTRHRILPGPTCEEGELVARQGIEIPDSAAVSPDGRWLAVADHDHSRVLMFALGEGEAAGDGEAAAVGQLEDPALKFPHGVVFDRSGTILLSTDAGGRDVHLFHAPGGDWRGGKSAGVSRVDGVAEAAFVRVQAETPDAVRHLEGGPKGIDVSRDGRVVVTTCRGATLRAYTLHG